MRPPQVQIDFGTPPGTPPRTSSDFEEIHYPSSHPSYTSAGDYNHEESLPLHYMNEDTSTRRRVARGPGSSGGFMSDEHDSDMQYDDEGKDVYSKLRLSKGRVSSGRVHRPPPPPPTSIVRTSHCRRLLRILTLGAFPQSEFLTQNLEHIPPVIYTLLSCWTRFHKIGHANTVVWDEAHFGKFGSHYLKREFYFDVHPPLGKMLVGLAGLLSGYNGHFEFKSGEAYDENVPYVAMRVMMATFGVALVPLGWYTAVELGMSSWACHLVALMVLCGKCWLHE
jgi:dolichyl-phosphate-mannose-protein mannosyltransferase